MRHKIKKANLTLDMAAMSDVAFLLLCFFVVASSPKYEVLPNNLPAATQTNCEIDQQYAAVIILRDGEASFVINDPTLKKLTLRKLGKHSSLYTHNDHELYECVKQARLAYRELYSRELPINIAGNQNESYTGIKLVIDSLQSQKINRFNLVTTLKQSSQY